MPQIDAKDLDYSHEMRTYFDKVTELLVERHDKSPGEARKLVERFFHLEVDPLERAFVMHSDAEAVAADLAGAS